MYIKIKYTEFYAEQILFRISPFGIKEKKSFSTQIISNRLKKCREINLVSIVLSKFTERQSNPKCIILKP